MESNVGPFDASSLSIGMDVGFLVKEIKVVFLKPVKEVQGSLVFGGQVVRLDQNLPYVKPKPIGKGCPLTVTHNQS